MTVVLRDARRGDVADLLRLIRDLARYEKAEDQVEADVPQLAATLFGEGATAHAMVAEQDGLIVGLAIYFFNYSTWQGRNGLYLDWNTPAIDFYESLGARPQSEWVRYRLEGDALKALANTA